MSISATSPSWNAVESERPSPNRSTAHSSRCHGSCPSNSTASSPTSSSSNSSTLTALASSWLLRSCRLHLDVSSLARRRRHAGERGELLVGRACRERGERLVRAASLDPALYETAD